MVVHAPPIKLREGSMDSSVSSTRIVPEPLISSLTAPAQAPVRVPKVGVGAVGGRGRTPDRGPSDEHAATLMARLPRGGGQGVEAGVGAADVEAVAGRRRRPDEPFREVAGAPPFGAGGESSATMNPPKNGI